MKVRLSQISLSKNGACFRYIFAALTSIYVVKRTTVILIILVILFFDQALKFYIKTNFYLGQEELIFGDWFRLHFVENEGMAWGWKLGENGSLGKMVLTLFRLVAVIFGVWYINQIVKRKEHPLFITCVALIFAGAVGNLIDSLFYGIIFEESSPITHNVAKLVAPGHGYGRFLHGKVVDMLYFPVINTYFPSWVPKWGGQPFEFFSAVFNIADASISIGLGVILVFQRKMFSKETKELESAIETNVTVNDENQVS